MMQVVSFLSYLVNSQWKVLDVPDESVQFLARALRISPVLARILWIRGCKDEMTARQFLNCQLRDLTDPFLLPGLTIAVDRMIRALKRKECVMLYGDYDVDGVASVAIMKRVLSDLGATGVQTFLPDRFDEGYGLTQAGIERCLSGHKPDLLVVLDCGTNSHDEISCLHEMGVDVMVFDHHEPSLPAKPLALVNYKIRNFENEDQASWISPEYCTAGLVFKFCHGLLKAGRQCGLDAAKNIDLKIYLDFVALATVADIAPLMGENRILTLHGLRQMSKTRFPGLRALMKNAGIRSEPTGYDCGFRLGPRLNAAGRLESALASLQLLLSDDEEESVQLSSKLDSMNRERQAEALRVLSEARADAESQFQDLQTRVLVVARSGWHEGVVGIVASRIMREFHRPTFVLAIDETGIAKGSGRSIEGFDLAAAVDATRSFLLRGGGHAMAAGVSLEAKKIESWQVELQRHARIEQGLDGERLRRLIRVDAEVMLSQLNMELIDELKKMEPCGMGNPRPLFMARKVEVMGEPRTVGVEGKHLKLRLRQNGMIVDAIGFGHGRSPVRKGNMISVLFEVELNDYQGIKQIQMNIREIVLDEGIF